jgi:hypothetical protein
MNASSFCILLMLAAIALTTQGSCNRGPTTQVQGCMSVDQDGNPLARVKFDFRVEAYPKNWSFDTRGRDNDVTNVTAFTDDQGRFRLDVTGCQLIRLRSAPKGFKEYYDEDVSGRSVDNRFYSLITWGQVGYRSDVDNPAVYVFVNNGTKTITVLPSRGGFDHRGGSNWSRNTPALPRKPSLREVVYEASPIATTQP